ncbi:hypothetical protein JW905_12075 [bacterium]|nr:hypothetical protein [candidate division CSSED10-310 bacterium]
MDHEHEDRRVRQDDLRRQVPLGSVLKIVRCESCSERNETIGTVRPGDECRRCGAALHACVHCEYLDYKARLQCTQPLQDGITDKQAGNECRFFSPRFERDPTLDRPMTEDDARRALDRLFKL